MEMRQHERVLKALANKRRLEILKYLKNKKSATVGDIANHIKLSFKSTSKHLGVLANVDIVEKEQKGLTCLYFLKTKPPHISKLIISIL